MRDKPRKGLNKSKSVMSSLSLFSTAKTTRFVIGFDTEDDGNGNPYLWCFVDNKGARHFWSRDKALRYLENLAEHMSKQKQTIEAWATNLEYDLINLFGEERIRELDLSFGKSYLVGAKWRGRRVVFRDTVRHLPMGVKSLGDIVGLKKLEFDHKSLKDTDSETN